MDLALFVAVYDGGERGGHVGQRIDRIKLTGLDERCDSLCGPAAGVSMTTAANST